MKRFLLTIGAVLVAAGIFAGGYFTARKHYRNPYDDYLPPFADLNVYNVKTAEDMDASGVLAIREDTGRTVRVYSDTDKVRLFFNEFTLFWSASRGEPVDPADIREGTELAVYAVGGTLDTAPRRQRDIFAVIVWD